MEEVHNIIKESSDKIVSAEIEKRKNPRIKIVGVHNLNKINVTESESDEHDEHHDVKTYVLYIMGMS